MKLEGKVAIVTGAGQGIGKASALELGKAGAQLVLADLKREDISRVKEEIEEMGRKCLAIPMDVSKWKDVEQMVEMVIERFGRIDILVNNAGINPAGISPRGEGATRLGILETSEEIWDTVLNVNLKGVFFCSKAVMPYMMGQRSGKIINIGSVAGLMGGTSGVASPPYSASKAGVICLTKVLARELGPYNVNVNVIAPGRIITEMSERGTPEAKEAILKQTPLGRAGIPADIARAVLFLASEDANFMTGETIIIDGGKTMR